MFHLKPTSWFVERVGWWFERPYVDIYGIRPTLKAAGPASRLVAKKLGAEGQQHLAAAAGGEHDGPAPMVRKIYLVGTEQQVHMLVDELLPINRTALVVAGRQFAGPRNPEAILEAMYGVGWSTPDPLMRSSLNLWRAS